LMEDINAPNVDDLCVTKYVQHLRVTSQNVK